MLPQYEILRRAIAPFPELAIQVDELRQAIDLKLAELDQTVELVRDGQVDRALEIVRTDRGRGLMEEAQALFVSIVTETDQQLTQSIDDQRSAAGALRWTTILGAFVIMLVVGGSVWTAVTYTRELRQAQDLVQTLNAGLEERVRSARSISAAPTRKFSVSPTSSRTIYARHLSTSWASPANWKPV